MLGIEVKALSPRFPRVWMIKAYDRGLGRVLIRAAWGPRRASSRTRYGEVTELYPPSVSCTCGLWWMWIKESIPRRLRGEYQIVIQKPKAKARIAAAVANAERPVTHQPVGPSDDEINDLLAQRAALRAERRFKEADEIRDRLVSMGVSVADGPVNKGVWSARAEIR